MPVLPAKDESGLDVRLVGHLEDTRDLGVGADRWGLRGERLHPKLKHSGWSDF